MIERSDERIRTTGEVFTPPELTNEVLDGLGPDAWKEGCTFLDPAAGDGNILIEVLKRKIKLGHSPTQAISTIYGIDLMGDNVQLARERILKIAGDTPEHQDIVNRRILQGNALTFDWGRFNDDPLMEF